MPTLHAQPQHAPPRTGFTLIELLVAMAIIALLMSILAVWGISAFKSAKVRRTHAAMSNALAMAQMLDQKSLVRPDHRLANFYWVQLHTAPAGTTPAWGGPANARRMASGEFLVFLASQVDLAGTMLETIGPDYLKGTPVPAAWNAALGDRNAALVDVFEQDPDQPLALSKDPDTADPAKFHLVSAANGYPLRGIFDSWGNEVVYRYSTHQDILNLADTEVSTPPLNQKVRENITQDEAATRARYAAMGRTVNAAAEYVRPAVAGYFNPMLMSPGPDGLWGAFTDGAPPQRNAQAGDLRAARDEDARDNPYSVEWGR